MQRYYNIELLRFLCALTVAIYHWGLSFELMMMENNDTFRDLLNFAYDHGANAVPVFFVISGLVFANVYLSQEKNETLHNFAIKRFARLYPLHLLTLFLILLLQTLFLKLYGKYELYTFNDIYHFFLNITLLLGWNFELGRSFNTPVWTVGQEMVIYVLFFSLMIFIKKHQIKLIILIYLFFLTIDKLKLSDIYLIKEFINFTYFIDFTRLFFSGIFIYYIINKFGNSKLLLIASLVLLGLSFIGTFKLHLFCFSTVLLFVLLDMFNSNNKLKQIFTFLGSLTYSVYLLHTLTFLIFLFLLKQINKIELFYHEGTFIIYIFFTILLSSLSFKFFENTLNKLLRNKLIKKV